MSRRIRRMEFNGLFGSLQGTMERRGSTGCGKTFPRGTVLFDPRNGSMEQPAATAPQAETLTAPNLKGWNDLWPLTPKAMDPFRVGHPRDVFQTVAHGYYLLPFQGLTSKPGDCPQPVKPRASELLVRNPGW